MNRVKSRNWSIQEDQQLVSIVDEYTKNQKKPAWNQIAQIIRNKNPTFNKNGKQCRERWSNHLNPQVNKTEQWDDQQNKTLFNLHHKLGNKWSQISKQLPGRTDNSIKNHFNSVMRRGLRKLNQYIKNVKRKQVLVKTIKNDLLTKVLALCQGKKDDKFQFSIQAKQLAVEVKNNLAIISLDGSEESSYNAQNKQLLYKLISQFKKNCKRRKSKKNHQSNSDSSSFNDSPCQKPKKKQKQKQQKKQTQVQIQKQIQIRKKIPPQKITFLEDISVKYDNKFGTQYLELIHPKYQPEYIPIDVSAQNLGNKRQQQQFNLLNKSSQINILLSSFPSLKNQRSNASSLFNFGSVQNGFIQYNDSQGAPSTPSFLSTIQDVSNNRSDQNFKGEVNFSQMNFLQHDLGPLIQCGDLGPQPNQPRFGYQISFPQAILSSSPAQIQQMILSGSFQFPNNSISSSFSLFHKDSARQLTELQFRNLKSETTNPIQQNTNKQKQKQKQTIISKSTNL